MGEASAAAWSFMTEVKDGVATQTTAALSAGLGDVSSMAFKFLKLTPEMVSTLKEFFWNGTTIAILVLASRYLNADIMLVVTAVSLIFGPFLVELFFKSVGFLIFLAIWAPNVFLSVFCLILFCFSKTGEKVLTPIWTLCAATLKKYYEAAKAQVTTNVSFVKLDAIESAVSSSVKTDPSIEARLAKMELMLEKIMRKVGGDLSA